MSHPSHRATRACGAHHMIEVEACVGFHPVVLPVCAESVREIQHRAAVKRVHDASHEDPPRHGLDKTPQQVVVADLACNNGRNAQRQ